jgi:hypothetical protein
MSSILILIPIILLTPLTLSITMYGFRPTIIKILNLYRRFNIAWLALRGSTPTNEIEKRIVSGKAWEEWADTIKAAAASLTSNGCPTDPFNQAEGYRYLSRLVRASLENFLECNDPSAPVLVSLANGLRDCPVKLGADNPDNLYQNANLDARETYKLWGNRGSVNILAFATQFGTYGGPGGLQTVMTKSQGDYDISPDGSFEFIISATPPPPTTTTATATSSSSSSTSTRNWLQLKQGTDTNRALLIVRQTFINRDKEKPAEIHIRRMSGPHQPQPLTCEQLDEALKTSGMFVAGASMMFARWSYGFQKHPNTLPLFDQETSNKAGGDPNIRYYHSYWQLAEDEVLYISVIPPPCQHWNFQLNNHWMESLDYRYFTVHVNKGSAKPDGQNRVRVIISHSDPAGKITSSVPYNWINTCNHNQGQMLWRWISVDPAYDTPDRLPQPKCKVLKWKKSEELNLGDD